MPSFASTTGVPVDLATAASGTLVLYVYPRTGTPGEPVRASSRGRSSASVSNSVTVKTASCTGSEKPRPATAAAAAATAATLMNAQPKCGTDTSSTAAISAIASQNSAPISAAHDENSADSIV